MTDPGLARERTTIAWARTALGATAFGIVLLRLSAGAGAVLHLASAVAALVCAAQLSAAGRGVYRHPGREPRAGLLRIVTVEVAALGGLIAATAFA